MTLATRLLATLASTATMAATSTKQHVCTLRSFEHAARTVYRGAKLPRRGSYRYLWMLVGCQKDARARKAALAFWGRAHDGWAARRRPMSSAVASWYDAAGGPIACGGNSYALGVANKTLPCGTRLEVCYSSCVNAIVFDRGPFVPGREFDLSGAVKNAIGFPDLGVVRYRVLR